jgi:2-keto-4-pentenoate hydratase/2-oxohepta-3-ene-1,7-dioic acid hydratase in catechol pathway
MGDGYRAVAIVRESVGRTYKVMSGSSAQKLGSAMKILHDISARHLSDEWRGQSQDPFCDKSGICRTLVPALDYLRTQKTEGKISEAVNSQKEIGGGFNYA